MLGVCLLFVGIVLINNGMCSLYNVDGKSTAIMNIFTGGLSLFINFVNLVQGNYYAGYSNSYRIHLHYHPYELRILSSFYDRLFEM